MAELLDIEANARISACCIGLIDDKSINMYNNQAILENDKNDPILSLQFDQLLNIYVI